MEKNILFQINFLKFPVIFLKNLKPVEMEKNNNYM